MITDTHASMLSEQLGEDKAVLQSRMDALKRVGELPLPSFKEGLSTSVDGTRVQTQLSNSNYHKDTTHTIEKQEDVIIKLFSQATQEERELIKKHRYSLVQKDEDKLISLQEAACSDGILVIVPQSKKVQTIINLRTVYAHNGFSHIVVIAKEGSQCMITRTLAEESQEKDGLVCEVVEIIAQKDAQITYNEKQELNKSTVWYSQKAGLVSQDANINWYTHIKGSTLSRVKCNTWLKEESSEVLNLLTTKLVEHQHADTIITNYHQNKKTTSGMYAKAVIADSARLLYRGLVDIGKTSSDANGYQQEDVLLIGEKAEADAIPQLEIKNPNVACSHGATVGKMDAEALFYLRSRGIEEEKAQELVTAGFLASILTYVQEQKWRNEILRILEMESE